MSPTSHALSRQTVAATAPTPSALTPQKIFETGFAFWPSKVLLTAVELGVFTTLGARSMNATELRRVLSLHPRGIFDFFDTLVALGSLEREGTGPLVKYRNTPSTAQFLDRGRRLLELVP